MHAGSVAKSNLILCGFMDCNPPGFSVHGVFQARILECVAICYSTGSLWPRDQTHISCIVRHVLLPQPLGRRKKTSKSYPPVLGKGTLTGNRVLADVIKLRILKGDHPELRMDSKSNDSCPYKWKEREVEDGARDGVMLPHAKEHRQPGEVGETRKGLLS